MTFVCTAHVTSSAIRSSSFSLLHLIFDSLHFILPVPDRQTAPVFQSELNVQSLRVVLVHVAKDTRMVSLANSKLQHEFWALTDTETYRSRGTLDIVFSATSRSSGNGFELKHEWSFITCNCNILQQQSRITFIVSEN